MIDPIDRTSRLSTAAGGVAVALIALAALVFTSRDFGIVWDEGHTLRRVDVLEAWFARLIKPAPGRSSLDAFGDVALRKSWPFSREEPDGHPPFYAELSLAGRVATRGVLAPLASYRAGAMALCAATAGVLFVHLRRRAGLLAAVAAPLFLVGMPRSFAHAHYAHYDMPMTCLWLLAQIAFVASLGSRRWSVAFGVLLGLAAGTKFTGLFAPVPALLWVLAIEAPNILRRRGGPFPGLRSVIMAAPIAVVTLYAIQPPWWFHPIDGPWRFIVSNLTRSRTQPIPTLYLGRVYPFALPWHNTAVLTAVCVPAAVLLLGAIGLAWCLSRRGEARWAIVWPLSWAVLMVVRALPNAPGHDGIRLFLPSIASLGVLAALGASAVSGRCRGAVGAALVALAVAESAEGMARTYPYTDSYYNRAVGGLPGAERRGFEVTYYWESIGPEFLARVRREAPTALRLPIGLVNVRYLRAWGDLPPADRLPIVPLEPATGPSYVLQRRRGVYYPYDWWLEHNGRPRFAITREGVDLLRVYSFAESFRAYEATKDVPVPAYLHP